jgi:hypothetical protein
MVHSLTFLLPILSFNRQRIHVLNRAVTFGKHFRPGKPEVRAALDRNIIIQLILQHLEIKGLKEPKKILEREAKVKGILNN